jgi:predicted N-formylglutamate amidohydrolase
MRDAELPSTADMPLSAASYEIVPGRPDSGLVVLCDHAGNALPEGYGTLGLPPDQLERHIGYDIGAAGVVRGLARRLGATAVLSRYSRLLIDLNRGADDPTLVMRLSDSAIVPGNAHIDAAEWDRRIRLYYEPYHRAVDCVLDQSLENGLTPIILSVHSFTDAWKGVARPWHAGILWDSDARLPLPLLAALRQDPALVIGDNEPYSGQLFGDCLYQHATSRGFAHALIEVRQDLIASETGQQDWAERLAHVTQDLLADPDLLAELRTIRYPGARLNRHRGPADSAALPLQPSAVSPVEPGRRAPAAARASAPRTAATPEFGQADTGGPA